MPQIITLNLLRFEGVLTVSVLAARLRLTRGTVSHMVDRLVRRHLVTREENVEDRRVKRVELTPVARELLAKIQKERRSDFEQAFARLKPGVRSELLAILLRVNGELRGKLKAEVEGRKGELDVALNEEPTKATLPSRSPPALTRTMT